MRKTPAPDHVLPDPADLDLETKAALLGGRDMWSLPAVPAIGLDSLVMSDGPVGVRGTEWSPADPSIALPSPTALAATWDPELAWRAGRLLAGEARRKGVHVLLAPTVNLHRTPLGGRHFECYSEDPLLTAEIGAGYVTGVQSGGVAACVKHFVANDSETERYTLNAVVSERALRELYLAPFETIVRRAGAWAVMSAYNGVNGPTMTENGPLQIGVLKDEWGFDGCVISDWTATRTTEASALGGLDVAMPGPVHPWGPHLAEAVRSGAVPEEVVDEQVRRVLLLAARTGALGLDAAGRLDVSHHASEPPGATAAPAASPGGAAVPDQTAAASSGAGVGGTAFAAGDGRGLAREVAVRSFVLARNDGTLPLAGGTRVALIGGLAKRPRIQGGGSALVYPAGVVSPYDALRSELPGLTFATGADPRTKLAPLGAGGPPSPEGVPSAEGTLRGALIGPDGAVLHEEPLSEARVRWQGSAGGVRLADAANAEISGTFTPAVPGPHTFGVAGVGPYRLEVDGDVVAEGRLRVSGDDPGGAFLNPPEARATVSIGHPVPVRLTVPVRDRGDMTFTSFALGHAEPGPPPGELIAEAVEVAREADVAVVVVGTSEEVESEGRDRTDLRLPGRQDELVRAVADACPRTVVVVNAGSPVELPWAEDVAAVLLGWFPGQEGGAALADVLLGHAEPGGRLPTTWPVTLADCPVTEVRPRDGELRYDEGVFIGYRAWQRAGTLPRYPFGHGFGYTTWAYEEASIRPSPADAGDPAETVGGPGGNAGGPATVDVRLRNTGTRPGREVVQVYLAPDDPGPGRPARVLAGFATAEAEAGAAVTVRIPIAERATRTWDETAHAFRPAPGPYTLEISHSLTDTRLTLPYAT